MGNKSEPEDGASALPHPKMGKREGDDEDKKQVIAKKRKKDEVAEEQKNKEEINSDYSEHDKKPEAGKSEPANSCGSLESSDDGGSEPDSDRSSDEDNGAMDICKGDSSKQCDEEAQKIKMEVLMNAASDAEKPDLKTVKMDTSNDTDSSDDDDDDDDHDDDSSDGTEKRDMVQKPVKDLESPEYNEYEIEDKISKTPQERNETPVTLNEKYAASKTIYVRNLSYSVERADMENLFKDCGEVVDVRFNIDREGRFRGFGHVEFGTTEAAQNALELDNTELLKRRIKVGIALERGGYAPNRSLFHKCGRFQSDTLSVKDFDTSHVENKPKTPATPNVKNAASKTIFVRNLSYIVERADMENLFKDCGEIVDIRLHTDREGRFKGFGHIEFATAEAAQKAVELDNTEVLKRRIIVGIAQERGEYTPNRSSWSSSFHKDERFQSQNVPAKCLDTPLVEHKLTCAKEVKDMEMFDASSAENKPETPATRKEKNAASKTICLRNLSYGVERADIENLFKDCGEIVDVRLHMDVEFATAEAAEKALELDYMELLNRPIKVGIAPEKGEYFPNSSLSNSFQKDESFQSLTVFVIGFDTSLAEEKIKASLKEHFSSCGEITRISIPKFPDYGAVKGFAHLDFKDFDGFKKALQLNQTELQGYRLSVEKAKPKPRRDNQGIGGCIGGGGGSYHFGGRDGGDHGGRVSWGDNQGIGGGRGGGGSYHYGRRDGGDHGGRVGWGDNQGKGGGGGSYHYGGRDGGDHGGRVGWGRSHGAGRHWTANIPSTDEGTGTKNTFDYRRY